MVFPLYSLHCNQKKLNPLHSGLIMQLVAIIVLYIMTIDNTNVHKTHTHTNRYMHACMHTYIHTFHANTNPIIISLTCAVESFAPYIEH